MRLSVVLDKKKINDAHIVSGKHHLHFSYSKVKITHITSISIPLGCKISWSIKKKKYICISLQTYLITRWADKIIRRKISQLFLLSISKSGINFLNGVHMTGDGKLSYLVTPVVTFTIVVVAAWNWQQKQDI